MINKLLQRIAALSCALMLCFTSLAQVEFQPYCVHYDRTAVGVQSPNVTRYSSSSYPETNLEQLRQLAQKAKAKAKAGEAMCTITLNMEYDPEVYEAPFIAYIFDDHDVVGFAFDNGQGSLQGQVPQGVYDIVSCFTTEDHSQYYVIFEQQQVKNDLTLTLDPTVCTNSITVNNYGPDGELLKLGLAHEDEEGQFIVDEEGDYYHILVDNQLCRKGLGTLYSCSVDFGSGPQLDEESRTSPLGFHVNDVSDRFYFQQVRVMHSEDLTKSYVCYCGTDNLTTSVVENNPNNYVQQVYDFKYTSRGREQIGYGISDILWRISKKVAYSFRGVGTSAAKLGEVFTHEVWANIPETNPYDPDEHFVLQLYGQDYGDVETVTFGEWVFDVVNPTAWIVGPAMRVNNGQKESINIGHHEYDGNMILPNFLYGVRYDSNILPQLLPSPTALTYPTELSEGLINDNCPINALKVTSYVNENDNMVYLQLPTNYFVGRHGEAYCCQDGTTMTAKFRGNEIDMETFAPDGLGTYEFTVDNPIVEVDGLPGHNTTTVYFDQNQEDMTPPAVEMLHFRSEEGVTDRFATAADGTMEFYASDFHYQYYPDLWNGVFECQPVEVTVEYAPYATEEWNELAVEEIPEYYQEPGWGYFYRGSLAGVTGEGLNGWFDLRFRLQDASGNWMDQVVSPAFRIDDQAYSSVATVGSDNAREVARYNLAGQRVDANTPGVAIIRMSDGTARKVIQ